MNFVLASLVVSIVLVFVGRAYFERHILKAEHFNMEDIAVSVKNVSKKFRIPINGKKETLQERFVNPFHKTEYVEFYTLNNLSFDVKKNEFFSVIGPNGAGKSTLLKIVSGIYIPDSGKVVVNGDLVPFLELGVGFNPELTARENVYLNGTILGLTKKEVDEYIDEIFRICRAYRVC